MNEIDEIVGEFLVESYENLDRLDEDFVALESDPSEMATLGRVFRTIHTIKGTCGFLGFGHLERLTHAGENLLSKLRDGVLQLDSVMTTALLALVDAVRVMLAEIERSGTDGSNDHGALVAQLASFQPDASVDALPTPVAVPTVGEILVRIGAADPEDVTLALAEQSLAGGDRPLGEILVDHGVVTPETINDVLELQINARGAFDSKPTASDCTIRVDVNLLDKLMNLVGELVLARNNIVQHVGGFSDPALQTACQRLDLVTGELHEGVMKTRMQPIGTAWSKFPRVVRDLAAHCGKQVRIETEGEGTELDRTIIEAIKDPLTHIVRNAIDHGIEPPEARAAAGKPAMGVLRMRAHHESGQVIIEVADDGAGIDAARVKAKACSKGVISADQAATMTDREAMQLIFAPGFSTAEVVTSLSGRGVGMDVVKTNIEKIGGTVDIISEPGSGTTLRVKIPLTLAIVPALLVLCDGVRYAIPQLDVIELVRLDGHRASSAVEWLHNAPVYRLRGNLLPLVDLREQLDLAPNRERTSVTIAVVSAGDRSIGLIVDAVVSSEEIVVKPLGPLLDDSAVFSGATILGDGNVALILDVLGIAERSGVIDTTTAGAPGDQQVAVDRDSRPLTSLLVVVNGPERVAIPLADIARLEEIDRNTIERCGGRDVVQYRGSLLPIVMLADLIGGVSGEVGDPVSVIVLDWRGRHVGVAVERIIDIVNAASVSSTAASSVIDGKVTQLVDIEAALNRHESWLVEESDMVTS